MGFATFCIAACVTGASVTSPYERPQAHIALVAPVESTDRISEPPPEKKESSDDHFASPDRPRAAPSQAELCNAAVAVAGINNLPSSFFMRLIQQESGFRSHVVSSAGAQGIAQFMPRTAASRGLANPFEPMEALLASGKYLAELVQQFGNLGLAAAAYNAGPGRVQDWMAKRGRLPPETRHYVYQITGHTAEDWAGRGIRISYTDVSWPRKCLESLTAADRVQIQGDKELPTPRKFEAQVAAPIKTARGPATERHSLPRPSSFVVGLPVSASIRAAERRAIKALERRVGTAVNGRPMGSKGSGKGSPEDPW
jgi:hypothetical protein